jgi:hypothetical protein
VLLGLLTLTHAQSDSASSVPDAIRAPAGDKVVLRAHASGVQIYVCQADSNGTLAWTLKAPEAELHDGSGKTIGRHYAGPSWRLEDGSQVTGQLVAKAEAPGSAAIPWLLVNVTAHSGNGTLSSVTSIQRINTRGGKPPATGCDASHRGSETRSSYEADYNFYAPAP